MYLCWSFNSTNTLFHILHSVYVFSEFWVSFEFLNILVLTSPLQLCFLNNMLHVQTQAPNSLTWKTVFASLCNHTRLPGAFCSDKATLLGARVPFCTVMVFLLAIATAWLEMQHRQHAHSTGERGGAGVSKIMTWKTSKKNPIQAAKRHSPYDFIHMN